MVDKRVPNIRWLVFEGVAILKAKDVSVLEDLGIVKGSTDAVFEVGE
jgi:hypothetical protein